jgi:hypothetical protein
MKFAVHAAANENEQLGNMSPTIMPPAGVK